MVEASPQTWRAQRLLGGGPAPQGSLARSAASLLPFTAKVVAECGGARAAPACRVLIQDFVNVFGASGMYRDVEDLACHRCSQRLLQRFPLQVRRGFLPPARDTNRGMCGLASCRACSSIQTVHVARSRLRPHTAHFWLAPAIQNVARLARAPKAGISKVGGSICDRFHVSIRTARQRTAQ